MYNTIYNIRILINLTKKSVENFTCDSDLNSEGLLAHKILYYNGINSTISALC